jgi:hypothetical protein
LTFSASDTTSVRLADGSTSPLLLTDSPVTATAGTSGEHSVTLHLGVLTNSISPLILGMDLLTRWNIHLANVPADYPREAAPEVATFYDHSVLGAPTKELSPDEQALREKCVTIIMAALADNNVKVKTSDTCTHPAAKVEINHKPGTPAAFRPQYKVGSAFEVHVDKQVVQWLLDRRIQVFTSTPEHPRPTFNMPLNPIAKERSATGELIEARVCVDARLLNKDLVYTASPMPVLLDALRALLGPIFSELDLRQFFSQLVVCISSVHKLGFTWKGVSYEFITAPFGVASLTHIAQQLMQLIFADMPEVQVWIDNLIIGTPDYETHVTVMLEVIRRLTFWSLRISIPKAKLCLRTLITLGSQLIAAGITADPSKVATIQDWTTPRDAAALGSFLGFANFLRDYVVGFGELQRPLLDAQHAVPFKWTVIEDAAFARLKEAVANAAVLQRRDPLRKPHLNLHTDWSLQGMGAILHQSATPAAPLTAAGLLAIISRQCTAAEANYSAYRGEIHAGVWAMMRLAYFLWGGIPFTWFTDHRPLLYLTDCDELNRPLSNLLHNLQEFNFTVVHVAGVDNPHPDALSRSHLLAAKYANIRAMRMQSYSLPRDEEHADELVRAAHKFGHFGVTSVISSLRQLGFSWPGMRKHIDTVIQNCDPCRVWSLRTAVHHPLSSIVANAPFQHMAYDVFDMPKSADGMTCIILIICQFSAFNILRAMPSKAAKHQAAVLVQVAHDFGVPISIHSDNEACNVSSVVESVCKQLGVKNITHSASNAHHENGKAERAIQSCRAMINKVSIDEPTKWPAVVSTVQYMVNNKSRDLTGLSPFRLVFNRPGRCLDICVTTFPADMRGDFERWMQANETATAELLPAVRERIDYKKQKQNSAFDARHFISKTPLPSGSVVMLLDPYRKSKDHPPFVGPYTTVSFDAERKTYELVDEAKGTHHCDVPREQLKHLVYGETRDDVFYVDYIKRHKKDPNGSYLYQVAFIGFDELDWLSAKDIQDPSIISAYWSQKSRITKTRH